MESGDAVLKNHLSTSNKKATYIKKNENKLIQLYGAQITKQITNSVKGASYFAIIADETSDSSHRPKEQLSLHSLR